jgi:hypothetical protein
LFDEDDEGSDENEGGKQSEDEDVYDQYRDKEEEEVDPQKSIRLK